ncbi:MAG: ChaN family lipoprotein [Pseudomonadota bacterium]
MSFFDQRNEFRAVAVATALFVAPSWAEQVPPEALDSLPVAEIVLLGEVHDNPIHHLNQARALEALRPAAVVFEMLTQEQAEFVNGTPARGAALGAALGWEDSGWPDFAMYQPVFEATGSARIYGMAVSREESQSVFGRSAAEVFGSGAGRFGLEGPLPDDELAAREAYQMAAHCDALPEHMLPGMVAAQRLRDAVFSRTALQALEETGGPVAVITGSGHVRKDWGMPAALGVAAPDVSVLAVGQVEMPAKDVPPFDLWLVTEPAEREDPCLAFRDRS